MAGTVSLRTLPIFISGQHVYKTQTSQEALRRLLSAHIFTQQLIRKTSEIIACLSLLGGAVKRSGPSYDSPLTYNLCSLAPNTPTSWYATFRAAVIMKSRFRESALMNPTIHGCALAGHTNQMVGVLALAELIDVGNLSQTALAGRTVGCIGISIMLVAIVVDDVADLGSPGFVRFHHSQELSMNRAVDCVLAVDRLVNNHTVTNRSRSTP